MKCILTREVHKCGTQFEGEILPPNRFALGESRSAIFFSSIELCSFKNLPLEQGQPLVRLNQRAVWSSGIASAHDKLLPGSILLKVFEYLLAFIRALSLFATSRLSKRKGYYLIYLIFWVFYFITFFFCFYTRKKKQIRSIVQMVVKLLHRALIAKLLLASSTSDKWRPLAVLLRTIRA